MHTEQKTLHHWILCVWVLRLCHSDALFHARFISLFSPFQLTHRLVPLSFDVHVENHAIIIWIGPTLKKTHLLCPNCQNITL